MSSSGRRAAALLLVLLSILTVTAGGAAAFYYSLKLLTAGNYLGIMLAAPIILAGMTFVLSFLLFDDSAAQKSKNKNSRAQ